MKKVLYVLALGIFGITTTEFGVIGILPQIAASFGISIDRAGWLLGAFALIIALFAPLMSLLFARMNRKWAMVLVLAVFALSNIISAEASTFPMLLIARMLPAFLHPVYWSIALGTATSTAAPGKAPQAAGLVFGGFTIASVLGVPLATWMAALFNWQASFVMCAVFNGIAGICLLCMLPSMPADKTISSRDHLSIFRSPLLWLHLALACLMIAAMYSTYGYLAAYLGQVTKMNGGAVSLMLLLFGIAGIGGNWLAGKLLSRNIRQTTIAFIALLAAAHVLIFLAGHYFIPMIIVIMIWGFIHTGGFLISNVNVTTAASGSPEFINSVFTSCGNLAVTLGSLIGGFAIAHIGIHQVVWTSVVLLIGAAIVLLRIIKI
ncbi:MFS transporter [Chitinophaga vietnamensis]|uniref:MFS transporter n=1 Tax=Chitinophaga vietnamensis TaxID=2593957 RepID=UPI00191C00B3|nr:MFS transporter [Chitinophaga vietnamensis]